MDKNNKTNENSRWSKEKANRWYEARFPILGCNYLPKTAVNSAEMWQKDTFDPQTINEELDLAKMCGMNSLRVFLPFHVWLSDKEGLHKRIKRFLDIAAAHGMSVMPVLFDDCAFAGKEPYLGKQNEPRPGVHNSGWTPSPGFAAADDPDKKPLLRDYICDILTFFSNDERILIWDLYNEPGNSGRGNRSLPLLKEAFKWARECAPPQPLTAGV